MRCTRSGIISPPARCRARARALGLPEQPTDVELECIAQTWSEHCKHKIFAGRVHYVDEHGQEEWIDSLFKTYIRRATDKIGKEIDWLVSVFSDNAGIIRFNDRYNIAYKVETHNSPSALDPYGGAITGIVGVNRDPMGTGMGCEMLCNVWGYCLGSPFYDGDLPEGLMHPRRIRDGVHQGVIDGGNQSGIPWARGFERFDDRYIGKPLVYCGTVGRIPRLLQDRPSERKESSARRRHRDVRRPHRQGRHPRRDVFLRGAAEGVARAGGADRRPDHAAQDVRISHGSARPRTVSRADRQRRRRPEFVHRRDEPAERRRGPGSCEGAAEV